MVDNQVHEGRRDMKCVILAVACAAFIFGMPSISKAATGETVVLLHGIARTKSSMENMEKYLSLHGYEVINIDYLSREKLIENLAADIHKEVKSRRKNSGKIHFVGHSMGGLAIRAYIHKYKPKDLGRVVMLGTPNGGSEVADFLKDNPLYAGYYGPAGQELVTDQSRFKKIYGRINYELGVIAGDRSIDPISSLFLITGNDNGKVPVTSTKIDGMKDHIVVHATHTFMPSNDQVIKQTEYFLKHGKFAHGAVQK